MNSDSTNPYSDAAPSSAASRGRDEGYNPFPIVGIGVSTDDLEALQTLLHHLPPDTGMAFIVVLRLDRHHETRLAEVLDRATSMPVSAASDGAAVNADQVYLIPPDKAPQLASGSFRLQEWSTQAGPYQPIDFLFASLAKPQRSRAIGIVLSGSGSDGTLGVREINAVGGITFAQDERSAKYPGMPRSAIQSGCIDFVGPPDEIARRLVQIGSHPYLKEEEPREQPGEELYGRILNRVKAISGADLSFFRDATIKRRIIRRMVLESEHSLPSYVERIEQNDKDADVLCHELVTAALRSAHEELRQANRNKHEFLAMLSHELRNPMAPILNAAEILRRRVSGDDTVSWCSETIISQVRLLARLLNDLLDVSRVAAGKVELRRDLAEVADILRNAAESCRPALEKRDHRLSLTLAAPLWLDGDPVRLTQVFTNLIDNATKYTPEGGTIEVSAERRDNHAWITIKDSGEGIDEDLLPTIFDMFVQSGSRNEGDRSGLGLGLTLVRMLVELHGGQVEVRSAGPGRGSEFIVALPVAARSPQPIHAPNPPVLDYRSRRPLRILVVDDNTAHARSLSMILEQMGHEARITHDGPQTLKLLETYVPHMALIDIGLPGMDGYQLARRIRERAELRHVVLLAQTGRASPEQRQTVGESGFRNVLIKPIEYLDLANTLEAIESLIFNER